MYSCMLNRLQYTTLVSIIKLAMQPHSLCIVRPTWSHLLFDASHRMPLFPCKVPHFITTCMTRGIPARTFLTGGKKSNGWSDIRGYYIFGVVSVSHHALKECKVSRRHLSTVHLSATLYSTFLNSPRLSSLRLRHYFQKKERKGQNMHFSNILPFLLFNLVTTNPILVPSLTVPIASSSPVIVPAGHPSSLTTSIVSLLQAINKDGGAPTTSVAPSQNLP